MGLLFESISRVRGVVRSSEYLEDGSFVFLEGFLRRSLKVFAGLGLPYDCNGLDCIALSLSESAKDDYSRFLALVPFLCGNGSFSDVLNLLKIHNCCSDGFMVPSSHGFLEIYLFVPSLCAGTLTFASEEDVPIGRFMNLEHHSVVRAVVRLISGKDGMSFLLVVEVANSKLVDTHVESGEFVFSGFLVLAFQGCNGSPLYSVEARFALFSKKARWFGHQIQRDTLLESLLMEDPLSIEFGFLDLVESDGRGKLGLLRCALQVCLKQGLQMVCGLIGKCEILCDVGFSLRTENSDARVRALSTTIATFMDGGENDVFKVFDGMPQRVKGAWTMGTSGSMFASVIVWSVHDDHTLFCYFVCDSLDWSLSKIQTVKIIVRLSFSNVLSQCRSTIMRMGLSHVYAKHYGTPVRSLVENGTGLTGTILKQCLLMEARLKDMLCSISPEDFRCIEVMGFFLFLMVVEVEQLFAICYVTTITLVKCRVHGIFVTEGHVAKGSKEYNDWSQWLTMVIPCIKENRNDGGNLSQHDLLENRNCGVRRVHTLLGGTVVQLDYAVVHKICSQGLTSSESCIGNLVVTILMQDRF